MCVTCLAFSAMALFSPVIEAQRPVSVGSANVPGEKFSQVQSMSVAEETRTSITRMLKQLPKSSDTRILHEEFKSLQARLAGVKDDAKAEAIIDDGLNALSKRVTAAPNSDQLMEVLFEMREAKPNPQLINSTQSKLLQGASSSATPFRAYGGGWGWLG